MDAGRWMLHGEGGGIGRDRGHWSLVDRVALLAACKVVAVMLTIRAHASLFMPPNPHPTSAHTILLTRSIVTVPSTDHIPLHPLAMAPPCVCN